MREREEARLEDMAVFVVQMGFTPDQYYALTLEEHSAIVKLWNRLNK